MHFNAELGQELERKYPAGTRVRLLSMPEEPFPPRKGTLGTVQGTSPVGVIYVHWDTGSTLNVLYGVDRIEVVK